MLVHHCETVNHKRSSVNESYDDMFARICLELKSTTVLKTSKFSWPQVQHNLQEFLCI